MKISKHAIQRYKERIEAVTDREAVYLIGEALEKLQFLGLYNDSKLYYNNKKRCVFVVNKSDKKEEVVATVYTRKIAKQKIKNLHKFEKRKR